MDAYTKKRVVLSIFSVLLILGLAGLVIFYIPVEVPNISNSISPSPANVTGASTVPNEDLLTDSANTTSSIGDKLADLPGKIKDLIPLPDSLSPAISRLSIKEILIRSGIVLGSTGLFVILYKGIKKRMHRVQRPSSLGGYFQLLSQVFIRQIFGLFTYKASAFTLGLIGVSSLLFYYYFGFTGSMFTILSLLFSGFGLAAITYFICQELRLSSLADILYLIFDIGSGKGTSLLNNIASSGGTSSFLVLLPLLVFISVTSYASFLMAADTDVFYSPLGIIKFLLYLTAFFSFYSCIGIISWLVYGLKKSK